MKLGLVSNCWQKQLEEGTDLIDLVAEATQFGFSRVELRQTCLGRFEQGDPPVPDAAALQELANSFPDVEFNVAVNVPFLGPLNNSTQLGPVFEAAVEGALAVAGTHRPHLRLVDLSTSGADFLSYVTNNTCQLAPWAKPMIEHNGWLSLEHSLQPWQPFHDTLTATRDLLGDKANHLRLCYDPVNLFFSDTDPNPAAVTRSLSPDEISMIHFKQRCDGEILGNMSDGDVDWRDQAHGIREIDFDGTFLFEIRSTENVWDELHRSVEYLRHCGFTLPV